MIMDKAVNGIIYFSLGADIKSSDLPLEKLEAFLKVFAPMEKTLILWKFESIALKERHYNNMIVGPWMPQQEILKHKNLKTFITSGGLLSTMEALYYGKPIIGIPFFNDQKFNMARAVSQGYGLTLDYDTLSEESIKGAIDTIFNDDSFRASAEKLAEVFRDNPIRPIDKAVHYVEHVIRNNGADHLKTAATKLSFCQIHLIDQFIFVLALITAIALIAICVLSKAMKSLKKLRMKLKTKFQKPGKLRPSDDPKRNKFKSN